MSSIPYFSVVIPTFHRNDTLTVMLDALAPGRQSLAPELYEVIVSDAGVTSTAEKMVRERFPWARWTTAPGCLPGANRNTGARAARGEWIVFVDDDCRLGPEFLASYHAMAATNRWDVLEGKLTCLEKVDSPLRRQVENLTGGVLITGNLAMRREVFSKIGPYDEDLKITEDLELGHRLRASGQRIAFCPEAVVDHPSQPMTLRQFLNQTFYRRWWVLFRYKTGQGVSPHSPDWLALARLTFDEVVFLLRVTWHLFSRHDASAWRSRWVAVGWALATAPFAIPYAWYWDVQYRRQIRAGVIRLRPVPHPDRALGAR